MVGGEVVGVTRIDSKVRVFCAERIYTDDPDDDYWLDLGNATMVWVEGVTRGGDSAAIEVGDSLWWQGRDAMWTTKAVRDGADGPSDVKIARIGYSFA